MFITIEKEKVDYVEMGVQRVLDNYKLIKKKEKSIVVGLLRNPDLFEKYYLSFFGINILSVNIWGKLYRRSVIEKSKVSPSGMAMGEDLAFNLRLFPYLDSIYILDQIGYNYRYGGMTTKYNIHLWPDLRSLYTLKEVFMERFNYSKAYSPIRIEIKNVFRSDVIQMIIFKIGNKEEIINKIALRLKDPIWEKVLEIKNHPMFINDPFVNAIQANDPNEIYNICYHQVQREYPKLLMKRCLSKILSFV